MPFNSFGIFDSLLITYFKFCWELGSWEKASFNIDFGFNFKKALTQLYKTTTVYEMTGVIYYLKFVNVCRTVSCLQKAV